MTDGGQPLTGVLVVFGGGGVGGGQPLTGIFVAVMYRVETVDHWRVGEASY